jgi:coenzyme F420-reducing hydrogenase gamma subunit
MVAQGTPCLGPVTQTGCGAICPAYGRGCYGCFGPAESPNTTAIAREFASLGMPQREIARIFRTFNAAAESFLNESEAHGE